jgi:hypothetical protein
MTIGQGARPGISLSLVLVILPFVFGCATIVSFSQSDLKVTKGRQLRARQEFYGILDITVPQISISENLAKQCPGGLVTGVETTLQKRDLIIYQIYVLEAKASCQGEADPKL